MARSASDLVRLASDLVMLASELVRASDLVWRESERVRMKEMERDGDEVYFELRVFLSKIGTKVQF